jgi:hypothetical protein
MKLTSDYRRVTALFDAPLKEEIEYQHPSDAVARTEFTVGPFQYTVSFDSDGELAEVDFSLDGIQYSSDEELVRIISEVAQREVSLEEAKQLERSMTMTDSLQIVGLGGSYSIKVFGKVLSIIRDYVVRYRPRCVVFTANNPGRTSLYRKMIQRAFPKTSVQLRLLGRTAVKILVCFEEWD